MEAMGDPDVSESNFKAVWLPSRFCELALTLEEDVSENDGE